MKKKTKILVLIIAIIILIPLSLLLLVWGLFFVEDYLCGSKNNLGNNIYMVEDGNFREIVYCTKHKGNTCYVGIPLIPAISSKGISVIEAKSNDKWVIVKAINNDLSEKDLGFAESVIEETLGDDKYTYIEGVKNPLAEVPHTRRSHHE